MPWFYMSDGGKFGPISRDEIRFRISSGNIKPTEVVHGPGMRDWTPANEARPYLGLPKETPADNRAYKANAGLGLAFCSLVLVLSLAIGILLGGIGSRDAGLFFFGGGAIGATLAISAIYQSRGRPHNSTQSITIFIAMLALIPHGLAVLAGLFAAYVALFGPL